MAAENIEVSVVYEDSDILVVDKPAGLLSVPIEGGTVQNMLDAAREYCSVQAGTDINSVHRIDRYTSGLMVFAKNGPSYRHLFEQFKEHTPRRVYLALARGLVEPEEGELTHHLRLIDEGFRNIVVSPDEEEAAPARLTYHAREYFQDATLVEIHLDTGLKNQIRVQFKSIGHQLVGDQHYAPIEIEEPLINRQALHAWKLEIVHPTIDEPMKFEARWPADMLRLIDRFRWERDMKA